MTPMNESLLKTDKAGRLRYTLVSWIKKGKMAGSANRSPAHHPALLSLVPAEVESSTAIGAGRAMEVLLSSGTKILISSPGQLDLAVVLIRQLGNARPC